MEKTQYSLKKEDSIYFDSIVKHHVHAAGKQEAKVLAVIYTLNDHNLHYINISIIKHL